MSEHISGLTDEEFFTSVEKAEDRVLDYMSDEDIRGLLVDTPSSINIDEKGVFPLLAFYRETFQSLSELRFQDHAVVVAADVDRNIVYVDRAMVPSDNEEPVAQVEPRPLPVGKASQMFEIDLRDRLAVEWKPATMHTSVIIRDKLSGPLETTLVKGGSGFRDEAVEEFIRQSAAARNPRTIDPLPGSVYPNYGPSNHSPKIPEDLGVSMSIKRIFIAEESSIVPLYGAFKLMARDFEVVRPGNLSEENLDAIDEHFEDPVSAIVGITLVVVGSNDGFLGHLPMQVPVFSEIDESEEMPVVTGYFAINLRSISAIMDREQTFFVYAMSSDQSAGPFTTAFVSRESLEN